MPKYLKIHRNVIYEEKMMKDIDFQNSFFLSFMDAYSPYYFEWILKKKEDSVLVAYSDEIIVGFLKLKIEDREEDYSQLVPILPPGRRLKISSFKVIDHDHEVTNTLYHKVITTANENSIGEIYATIPIKKSYTHQLERFLLKRGFKRYGTKTSHGIEEDVYILRDVKNEMPFIQL